MQIFVFPAFIQLKARWIAVILTGQIILLHSHLFSGLYIGISICTLCEIAELFITLIVIFLARKKTKAEEIPLQMVPVAGPPYHTSDEKQLPTSFVNECCFQENLYSDSTKKSDDFLYWNFNLYQICLFLNFLDSCDWFCSNSWIRVPSKMFGQFEELFF